MWFPDGYKENKVGHAQLRECAEKSMRADTYVLCNCHYMIKLMIDLKVTPALMQYVTARMGAKDTAFEEAMNGPATNMIHTGEPVVGLS